MKTANKSNRSVVLAGAAATLAVAALSFAGAAQARDNVFWSVGVGSPGVELNVGNAMPVYVQPQPVYIEPQPVYMQPAPVYYQPQPVYGVPQPVYYGRPHERHGRHDGYYVQRPRPMYGQGYAPVYYQREGGHENRRGNRDD
ncbi:MAG TPA: hypothetical protein DCP03_20630 [Polaromonas sp.]|uniref:hypothetical protein n=1 Tax=Polaromonas sp. UBA4122 TaxID=1947074 RepID=UPI000ED898D9|nr:hypothetical protein [Polaromonas sp. UBA4122]HAL40367.1 hypothetical protein [Polaromonas sp.]